MTDCLRVACEDVLRLLSDCIEPRVPFEKYGVKNASSCVLLLRFMNALRRRRRFSVICPDDRLYYKLYDLINSITMTNVDEFNVPSTDELLVDAFNLCQLIEPKKRRGAYLFPPHTVYRRVVVDVRRPKTLRKSPPCHFAFSLSTAKYDERQTAGGENCFDHPINDNDIDQDDDDDDDADDDDDDDDDDDIGEDEHDANASQNRRGGGGGGQYTAAYEKICDLLEAYVLYGPKTKRVWQRVENIVAEFRVRDTNGCCVALRNRLDDVAEASNLVAVVENATPLRQFLQLQADEIFARLKGDAFDDDPTSRRAFVARLKRTTGRYMVYWLRRLCSTLARFVRTTLSRFRALVFLVYRLFVEITEITSQETASTLCGVFVA